MKKYPCMYSKIFRSRIRKEKKYEFQGLIGLCGIFPGESD